jgi:hypothetical protein
MSVAGGVEVQPATALHKKPSGGITLLGKGPPQLVNSESPYSSGPPAEGVLGS